MCFTVRRICALNLKSGDFSKCIKHLNRLNHRQIHPEIVKEKVVIFDGNKRPLSSPFYMPLILVCLLSLLGLLYHFSSPILIVCMLVSLMKLQAQQYILLSPLGGNTCMQNKDNFSPNIRKGVSMHTNHINKQYKPPVLIRKKL